MLENIKKVFIILMTLAFFVAPCKVLKADDETGVTLADYENASEIGSADVIKNNLDLSKIRHSDINSVKVCSTNPDETNYIDVDGSKGCTLQPGVTQSVYYEKALDYGDDKVDIEVKITRTSPSINPSYLFPNNVKTDDINHAVLLSDNSVRFVGVGDWSRKGTILDDRYNKRSVITVEINFYLDNQPFGVSGLMGITDPDGSDYLFNTTNRKIYYSLASADENPEKGNQKIDTAYEVRSDGLYRRDVSSEDWIVPYWDNSILAIELDGDKSFTITYNSIYDVIYLPTMYSWYYDVEYDMNDDGDPTTVNPNKDFVKYYTGKTKVLETPTRTGYKFTGWTRTDVPETDERKDQIVGTDEGDKKFVAHWEKKDYKLAYHGNHENAVDPENKMTEQVAQIGENETKPNAFVNSGYEFTGWTTTEGKGTPVYTDGQKVPVTSADIGTKDDGAVVKDLYAQWKLKDYKIIYNKNADDATGTMDPQVFNVVNNTGEWNSLGKDDWSFNRVGYDLVGYKIEDKGDVITDPEKFRDYLLNVDNPDEVELFAQWEPWKYYIHYDGNGADNMNAMSSDEFKYFDDNMMSKKNAFRRDGYRFDGFRVKVNGGVKIVWSPEEFKEILIDLGPGSSVTLKAMWEKLPVKFQTPVTGVE